MPPLKCELTGKEMVSGYWSPASGLVFDKEAVEAHLDRTATDPKTGKSLQKSQLVPIQVALNVDSFAGAVAALYGEINSLKAKVKESQEALGRPPKNAGEKPAGTSSALSAAKPDLIKKTYEARMENLAKAKDTEIEKLQKELEALKEEIAAIGAKNKETIRKMIDEVVKRENFWKSKVAELENRTEPHQQPAARVTQQAVPSQPAPTAKVNPPPRPSTLPPPPPPPFITDGSHPPPGIPTRPAPKPAPYANAQESNIKRPRTESSTEPATPSGTPQPYEAANTDSKKRKMMVSLVQEKRIDSERRREADTPEALDTASLSMDVKPGLELDYIYDGERETDPDALNKLFCKKVGNMRCETTKPGAPSAPKAPSSAKVTCGDFRIRPKNGNSLHLSEDTWYFDSEKGPESVSVVSGDGSSMRNGFISPTDNQAYLWSSTLIHAFNTYNVVFDNSAVGGIVQVMPHRAGILIVLHERSVVLLQYKSDKPFRTYSLPTSASCMTLGPLPNQLVVGLQCEKRNLMLIDLENPSPTLGVSNEFSVQKGTPKDLTSCLWNRQVVCISDAGLTNVPTKRNATVEYNHPNITGRQVVFDESGTFLGVLNLNCNSAYVYRFLDIQKTSNPKHISLYRSTGVIDKIYWDGFTLVAVEKN